VASPATSTGRRIGPLSVSAVVSILLASTSIRAAAQVPDSGATHWPLHMGQRVQVVLPTIASGRIGVSYDRHLLRGTIAGLAPDTIYVQPHPAIAAMAIPRSAIRSLEVSRGFSRMRTALRWGVRGTALGVAAAATLRNGPCHRDTDCPATLIQGAFLGASLGAWLGAWIPREEWRRIPLATEAPR
jgi:hypothetical protein